MIRINLLPVRQARKREYGRQQLVLFFFLIILEVVILWTVLGTKRVELDSLIRSVADLQDASNEIAGLNSQIEELRSQEAQLGTIDSMLTDLQSGRIGPGAVLDDLKYIVNPPRTQISEREQRDRGFETHLDPSGIWLSHITIEENYFEMDGIAQDAALVAEFLLRLETAPRYSEGLFLNPELTNYRTTEDTFFTEPVKAFSIQGGIRYLLMANR